MIADLPGEFDGMELANIDAIDVHTHVLKSIRPGAPDAGGAARDLAGTFGEIPEFTVEEMAAYYRQRRMAAVVFTVDNVVRTGREPRVGNEEIA